MIGFLLKTVVHLCLFSAIMVSNATIHGRYSKSLSDYHLLIPHKLSADGEFSTFHLPHFYDHQAERNYGRRKRSLNDPEMIHYGVAINDHLYHVELWPNRDFLHPDMVIEKRDPEVNIKDRYVRNLKGKKLCHYTGKVRGYPHSKAAISTCDGLAGYITMAGKNYLIEPVDDHSPNAKGHHLHVAHDKLPNGTRRACGTRETWDEAMTKQLRERAITSKDIAEAKAYYDNTPRYLELGVFCDKKFLRFHKQRDVELYVMTLLNIVADFYHDESIGHQFHVVVVRIVYLEKEEKELDLDISALAVRTKASFCKWALKLNTPPNTPNHFDIAVLITRIDICFEGDPNCALTGIAGFGSGCSPADPCSINQDLGLISGNTVAHEIGHLLWADHDGDEELKELCPIEDSIDGSRYVMSAYLASFSVRWSACSRAMIGTWIKNKFGHCFSNVPGPTLYPLASNLPGTVYDSKEQCAFAAPESFDACDKDSEAICEQLTCKINATFCLFTREISADGTKCGGNKWCYKGKCVEMGSRPGSIDGGWSEFGPWSNCSRTCGGGLTFQERTCNNPVPSGRGRYCTGERRKMKICNPEPCPEGSPTFRQQQCTALNSRPWKKKKHKWTASFQEKEPCALYCVNQEHVLNKMEPSVKDGTPCKHGTKNMCIVGKCVTVGCDNEFESEAVEDRCGVCNGDGTQCKLIEETYKGVGKGYTKVVVIPAGARKITIEEIAPSENIMAITDNTEKKFYLNGNDTEVLDGEHDIGPAVGLYTHVEPKKEKFFINGPLKEDVVLFVDFLEQNNPGLLYKWSEPSVDSTYEPRYHWEIGEYEECSVGCGGGSQKSIWYCMEEKAGKVSNNFCAGLDKPKEQVKNCNEQPCHKTWKVGSWGHCRACKKKGGVRLRDVECVQENPKKGALGILLEDDQCEGPKPGSVELCETDKHCGRKRMISHIPGRYQSQIWSQMNRKYPMKRDHPEKKVSPNDCDSSQHSFGNKSDGYPTTLKMGQVVHDFVPLDSLVLEIAPLKPNPLKLNLSDKADALLDHELDDVIDTQHKTVFKGLAAAALENELAHAPNATPEVNSRKKRCVKDKSNKAEKTKVEPANDDDESDDVDSDEDDN